MYHNVKEEVFDGILKAALYEYIYDLDKSLPSDEEIAQMYPISRKEARKYKRIAKVNKYRAPLTVVYLRRAAAAVLVAVSLSFGLLATSAKVRAAIVDTVIEWYDKYIKIDFGNASDADTDTEIPGFESLNINYIPDGFEQASSDESEYAREYLYTADNGDYVFIGIYSSESTQLAADIEYSEYDKITINGNEAYIMYDEVERMGAAVIGNSEYTVSITSVSEKSDLIKILENIK